ncbi:histidine phosphatase family protein [Micromonospora sp. NPDC049559]|uniref:SixA phosphatase family protein n=1 Tax=Micromonospora sp. NPDC049559 TaxID=3155923 RepID=UPI003419D2B4
MTDRTIVLLRHAKAEGPTGTPDIERRLSARGHADAAAAGAWLAYGGYLPELVVCSPAKRTRQTWHDVALGMAAPPTIGGAQPSARGEEAAAEAATQARAPVVRYETLVYQGDPDDLMEIVRATEPEISTLLLIGHNPSISGLSKLLDPIHADPEGLRTSGIVVHRVPTQWSDLAEREAPVQKWHTARG